MLMNDSAKAGKAGSPPKCVKECTTTFFNARLLASHFICLSDCRITDVERSSAPSKASAWTNTTSVSATSWSTSRSGTSGSVFEWVFQRNRFAWKQSNFMARSIIVQKISEDLLTLFVEDRFGVKLHAFHWK